ncbi:MAG TPA: hypothetical protein VGU66_09505 [Candidatus Elarobacter sp.]|nr:hypothetical protein [Candidatus Elarobacter sp.]
MLLEEIVRRTDDFGAWRYADKIRLFAWFIGSVEKREPFTADDIAGCFEAMRVKKPSAIAPFLRAMTIRDSPELIHENGGFRLERSFLKAYDELFGTTSSRSVVNRHLDELSGTIDDPSQRAYLDETLVCFSNGAYRAAILMAWNLAFYCLLQWIYRSHIVAFNAQLRQTFPKANITIGSVDDFSYLREEQILTITRSGRLIPSGVYKVLKEKLDRRNALAHPSRLAVRDVTAEEYIRDLVENVILTL